MLRLLGFELVARGVQRAGQVVPLQFQRSDLGGQVRFDFAGGGSGGGGVLSVGGQGLLGCGQIGGQLGLLCGGFGDARFEGLALEMHPGGFLFGGRAGAGELLFDFGRLCLEGLDAFALRLLADGGRLLVGLALLA